MPQAVAQDALKWTDINWEPERFDLPGLTDAEVQAVVLGLSSEALVLLVTNLLKDSLRLKQALNAAMDALHK